MPRLNDDTMEQQPNVGTYGFSGTRIDSLGASEYTLATIVVDASGSVEPFQKEMESVIKEVVKACLKSPRADNLMLRIVKFNDTFDEIHGFKLLDKINLDDYDNVLNCGGMTLLYGSVVNAVECTTKYAADLLNNDYKCNAITVVITDGDDNRSKFGQDKVKNTLKSAVTSEALESMVSILVGVNVQDQRIATYLDGFHKKAGFTQYVELANATSNTLAKLAEFVSKSISAQSQALGTGGPSQSLSF